VRTRRGGARAHLSLGRRRRTLPVWLTPRPVGMLEASGMMLPLWEDVLPNVTDEELLEATKQVAAAL
jgi:hypothetical protein